jgi:hypothetical protein
MTAVGSLGGQQLGALIEVLHRVAAIAHHVRDELVTPIRDLTEVLVRVAFAAAGPYLALVLRSESLLQIGAATPPEIPLVIIYLVVERGVHSLGGFVAFGVGVGTVGGPVGGGECHVLEEGGEQVAGP